MLAILAGLSVLVLLVVVPGLDTGGSLLGPPSSSLAAFNRTVILVSIDGFRAEYLDRKYPASNDRDPSPSVPVFQPLAWLRSLSLSSPGMTPIFPTLTFPNHLTLVTGVFPDTHGIVSNTFYDPVLNDSFSYQNPAQNDPKWWLYTPV
jgi:predicted AlkP superfamily pyrophosphatase or phosphodiesterase